MDIKQAKENRDKLWSMLDETQKEMEPLKKKEAKIREKIKEIQDKLYIAEMEPRLSQLSEKAANDAVSAEKYNFVSRQIQDLKKKYNV